MFKSKRLRNTFAIVSSIATMSCCAQNQVSAWKINDYLSHLVDTEGWKNEFDVEVLQTAESLLKEKANQKNPWYMLSRITENKQTGITDLIFFPGWKYDNYQKFCAKDQVGLENLQIKVSIENGKIKQISKGAKIEELLTRAKIILEKLKKEDEKKEKELKDKKKLYIGLGITAIVIGLGYCAVQVNAKTAK